MAQTSEQPEQQEQEFICQRCGQEFESRKALHNHQRMNTNPFDGGR